MEDLIFYNNSFTFRHVFRYHAVLLRARFDEHANEMDARKAKKLLLDGEHELWLKMHPQPIKCNYFINHTESSIWYFLCIYGEQI